MAGQRDGEKHEVRIAVHGRAADVVREMKALRDAAHAAARRSREVTDELDRQVDRFTNLRLAMHEYTAGLAGIRQAMQAIQALGAGMQNQAHAFREWQAGGVRGSTAPAGAVRTEGGSSGSLPFVSHFGGWHSGRAESITSDPRVCTRDGSPDSRPGGSAASADEWHAGRLASERILTNEPGLSQPSWPPGETDRFGFNGARAGHPTGRGVPPGASCGTSWEASWGWAGPRGHVRAMDVNAALPPGFHGAFARRTGGVLPVDRSGCLGGSATATQHGAGPLVQPIDPHAIEGGRSVPRMMSSAGGPGMAADARAEEMPSPFLDRSALPSSSCDVGASPTQGGRGAWRIGIYAPGGSVTFINDRSPVEEQGDPVRDLAIPGVE